MFILKENNTSPILRATLKDVNKTVINLTGATVQFRMKEVGGTVLKVNTSASIVGSADNGVVQYVWTSSDTNQPGSFNAEFDVTYADGSKETFPNEEFLTVVIKPDLV